MKTMNLGRRSLTATSRPYIIAEIGVNHEGDMALAKRLIDLAREGGADAAKFQTYKANRIASRNSPAYWDTSKEATRSQHELFQKYDGFGDAEYIELARHCETVGIDFVSTPFDQQAVELLAPLMPFYKVASADLTNTPLLRQVAGKGKPVVLSTGASTLAEIDVAIETLEQAGCRDVVLLHCILNYPCPYPNANLNMINGLQRAYPDHLIGYSDHTPPDSRMQVATAAWLKGAVVIEKHFTHDKSLPGNDHYHAMDIDDLKVLVANIDLLSETFGQTHKHPLPSETPARLHARRSIVVDRPLHKGDRITEADITYKRPGNGISPLHWDDVVGRQVTRDLNEDDILQWSDLA